MAIKSLPFDVNSEAASKLRKEVNVFKVELISLLFYFLVLQMADFSFSSQGCDHVNVVRYFGCYDYGEDSVWVIMYLSPPFSSIFISIYFFLLQFFIHSHI